MSKKMRKKKVQLKSDSSRSKYNRFVTDQQYEDQLELIKITEKFAEEFISKSIEIFAKNQPKSR